MENAMTPRLLVIDNYDSFTYNLVQMFRCYRLDIRVHRSDCIDIHGAKKLAPDYILISPGPRDPSHAGISIAIIRQFSPATPILGVCLGMQCINEALGGQTVRAPLPVHGKTSLVGHCGQGIFSDIPSPFKVARYHSLMVDRPSSQLEITARSHDGVIMGLSHRSRPLHGVQFHPESFLTEYGFVLIENFLTLGPTARQPAAVVCRQKVPALP
jgi:anthranilate synthase component 2